MFFLCCFGWLVGGIPFLPLSWFSGNLPLIQRKLIFQGPRNPLNHDWGRKSRMLLETQKKSKQNFMVLDVLVQSLGYLKQNEHCLHSL